MASVEELISSDYAVILLDLYGIGTAFSSRDHGLAVLSALKSRSPATLVAVYSASQWDIDQQKQYWSTADAVIDKAKTDFVGFATEIDRLLLLSVDVSRFVAMLRDAAGVHLSEADAQAIRQVLETTSPHDIDARMSSLLRAVPRLGDPSGPTYGRLRDIIEVATKRMRPWTTSI